MPTVQPTLPHVMIWLIAAVAILGIIARPWDLPEALWAVTGALVLVLASLMPAAAAWTAVRRGTDVYLFLAGMMLLAEIARTEGLFDWVAALAVRWARGSPQRLFALVFIVGILVTAFLSNDATAVVLTPAVYAATRHARTEPKPYLLICAFVANAASFSLPIANPANLVVFASRLPPLAAWLARFTLPSIASLLATFFVLRATQQSSLAAEHASTVPLPPLTRGARVAALGIALTAVVLLGSSAAGIELGAPTFAAGSLTTAVALLFETRAPWRIVKGVAWDVIPLVAGLFVLVAGLDRTGVLAALGTALVSLDQRSGYGAIFAAGGTVAAACNIMNNLPVALIAGSLGAGAAMSPHLRDAMLIGADLGPNLSVTGSLATILWLIALRREKLEVSGGEFLKLGALVMPPALALALMVLQH